MREKDRRLLLRAIAGELGAEEAARLEARLAAEPGLRAAHERLARVQALVRDTPRTGFRPGFAGRVVARIAAETRPRLAASLAPLFRRLAPVALAIILALLTHNLLTGRAEAQSAVEAALGLEPVSLEVAFDFVPATYETAGEAGPTP